LITLPLISGTGEKAGSDGPTVITILLALVSLTALTHISAPIRPWSPVMDAWSAAPCRQNSWKAAPHKSAGGSGLSGYAMPELP
jgi:hypothetical protein